MMSFVRRRPLPLPAVLAAGLLFLPATAQEQGNPIKLSYTLSISGVQLGRLIANFEATDNGFHGRSETRAEGMASILLGGDAFETCRFTAEDEKIRSRSYESSKEGRGAYQITTEFDWDARKIHFSNDVTLDMPEGYVVDNCNLPFAAALSKGPLLSEQTLYIVDAIKQRIRGYQVTSITDESLDTVLGEINTVKVEMIRELRPDRSFTMWLASRANYFPVKMVEKRSSRTTTIKLESIEGI